MFTRQKSGAACVFDSDGKRYKLLIRDDLAEAIRDFHGSGKLTDLTLVATSQADAALTNT